MKRSNLAIVVVLLSVVAGLLVVLDRFILPYNTPVWREIANAGHTPYFGILSLVLLALSINLFPRIINNRLHHYVIAFFVTCGLGVISEYIQIVGPRDADIWDLARDVVGALTFLSAAMVFDTRLKHLWTRFSGIVRPVIIAASVGLFLAVWVPVFYWMAAMSHRDGVFPEINTFESYWDRALVSVRRAELEIADVPPGWTTNTGEKVGRVTFKALRYPTLYLQEPSPDWSGYTLFSFSVYSELEQVLKIAVTIDDYHNDREYSDRFNRTIPIAPGLNQVRIPVDDIRKSPATRDLDITAIQSVYVFAPEISEPAVLYFDDFRLEK